MNGRHWPATRWGWAAHLLMLAFHIGTVTVGMLALVQPSRTLDEQVTSDALTYVWSATFVLFGGVCLAARLWKVWTLEALSLAPVAGALMIWGVSILVGNDSGLQIGARLLVGSLMALAFGCFVFDWIKMQERATTEPVLNEINRALDERLSRDEER